jgi:hypothetical protein
MGKIPEVEIPAPDERAKILASAYTISDTQIGLDMQNPYN